MQAISVGLRDRKRIQTRIRLEEVAVELVLQDGLHGATIEAICEGADVSRRTFFNYFDTKEDAVLGLPDLELHEVARLAQARAEEAGDMVDQLIDLILELTTPAIRKTHLHRQRSEILRRYPDAFSRQINRITRVSDELLAAVHTLMARDPRFTHLAGAESPLAEPILALCSASVRIAAKEWIAAGSDAPIDEIKTRAIALAREVVENLR